MAAQLVAVAGRSCRMVQDAYDMKMWARAVLKTVIRKPVGWLYGKGSPWEVAMLLQECTMYTGFGRKTGSCYSGRYNFGASWNPRKGKSQSWLSTSFCASKGRVPAKPNTFRHLRSLHP